MPTIVEATRYRLLRIAIYPLVFLLSGGCAQLDPTRTGYLTDYSQLQTKETKETKIRLVRSRVIETGTPGLNALAGIDSFLIEPVGWLATDPSPNSWVEDYQTNLAGKLRQAMVDELGTLKPIVETPGPRTARVRAAVTHVAFARPIANTALSVIAVPLFNGGGVVEAEVIGPDKKQIAAVVAALPGRATDVLGFFTWQGHAELAMRRSATELKSLLMQSTPAKAD